jgi:hypothetical protein
LPKVSWRTYTPHAHCCSGCTHRAGTRRPLLLRLYAIGESVYRGRHLSRCTDTHCCKPESAHSTQQAEKELTDSVCALLCVSPAPLFLSPSPSSLQRPCKHDYFGGVKWLSSCHCVTEKFGDGRPAMSDLVPLYIHCRYCSFSAFRLSLPPQTDPSPPQFPPQCYVMLLQGRRRPNCTGFHEQGPRHGYSVI